MWMNFLYLMCSEGVGMDQNVRSVSKECSCSFMHQEHLGDIQPIFKTVGDREGTRLDELWEKLRDITSRD